MTRRRHLLLALLAASTVACDGGKEDVATSRSPTTTRYETGEAALKQAVRVALSENRLLSVYVLWNNRIPPWAEQSTRGPALASLRAAARNRRDRGVRVRMLESRREIRSVQVDASYLRATAIVVDRQRVQPSRRNGRPFGRATLLNERARYELRRVGRSNRFAVWRVVLLE